MGLDEVYVYNENIFIMTLDEPRKIHLRLSILLLQRVKQFKMTF